MATDLPCSHGVRAPIPQTRGVLIEETAPPSELNCLNYPTINCSLVSQFVLLYCLVSGVLTVKVGKPDKEAKQLLE